MRVFVLAALTLGAAARLPGQIPRPSALLVGAAALGPRPAVVVWAPGPAPGSTRVGRRPGGGGRAFGIRVVTGALGGAVGLAVGAVAASQILPRRECGDDPGLCEAIIGGSVGTVVGAGLGAAAPKLGSSCGFGQRASVGLVGAALGAVAGYAAGAPTGVVLLTFPLGAGVGGAAGAWWC